MGNRTDRTDGMDAVRRKMVRGLVLLLNQHVPQPPRRFVRMFKSRFAELVKDGLKRQTGRPTPKVMPRPGDIIDCRMWSGAAYRSKQVKLCEGMITKVAVVKLFITEWMRLDGEAVECEALRSFAKADGFSSITEMFGWFSEEHGLPFEGVVIYWEPRSGGDGKEAHG